MKTQPSLEPEQPSAMESRPAPRPETIPETFPETTELTGPEPIEETIELTADEYAAILAQRQASAARAAQGRILVPAEAVGEQLRAFSERAYELLTLARLVHGQLALALAPARRTAPSTDYAAALAGLEGCLGALHDDLFTAGRLVRQGSIPPAADGYLKTDLETNDRLLAASYSPTA